jgi:hypothetical protein
MSAGPSVATLLTFWMKIKERKKKKNYLHYSHSEWKRKKEKKEELLYGKTTKSSKGQAMLTLKGLKLPF